jgi:hypothetical protein
VKLTGQECIAAVAAAAAAAQQVMHTAWCLQLQAASQPAQQEAWVVNMSSKRMLLMD